MGNGQWAMDNGQWAMGNGQWATGNGQWAMGNGQWAMGNGQWATGNGQRAMGNGQWAMGNFFLILYAKSNMASKNFKETKVYQKAFEVAMDIFILSKSFPKEERYSLTDQIRRASRSVCANLAEAYRKRQYPLHFLSKISDCDAENSETGVWIDFALNCEYLIQEKYDSLIKKNEEVGKLLNHMLNNPEKY